MPCPNDYFTESKEYNPDVEFYNLCVMEGMTPQEDYLWSSYVNGMLQSREGALPEA